MCALLIGRTLADHRAAGNERGARIGGSFGQRAGDVRMVMPIARGDVPAGRGVAGSNIFAGRKVGIAVNRDAVIVPQHVQSAQLEMPGQADRFVIDAFHQATVTRDYPGAVINQRVTESRIQVALGQGHANRHRQALPQRTGGALHPFQLDILGVASARAMQLPEVADVGHGWRGVAGEVQ